MDVYEIGNILEITKDMLIYKDNSGNKKSIYFNECRKNWVDYVNKSSDFITWDGEPYKNISEKDTTCVGQRDWFDKKPYFEFFSNPKIKFEIKPQKRFIDKFNKHQVSSSYYKIFYGIRLKLEKAGWSTFDLG